MKETINKRLYVTAFLLYLNYFIHGIGVSILGQYKQEFAKQWGAPLLENGLYDVSSVLTVIAALGLGRLLMYPVAGSFSDRLGRKLSTLVGMSSYIIYFIGIALSPNVYVAYLCALFGGAANAFLDTGVIPACMEILVNQSGVAAIITRLMISFGQLALPVLISYVAVNQMSYGSVFYLMAISLLVIGGLLLFATMPENKSTQQEKDGQQKISLTKEAVAVIAIGFTCTSTIQLWLNCNQELGELYHLNNPVIIQSWYSFASIIAVVVTAFLVSKWIRPVRFLVVYPLISAIMLATIYMVESPQVVLVGGAIIGFSAAGGVLQLATATVNEMFPFAKGKITGIIMIASSIANYTILSLAGYLTRIGGEKESKYVLLLNLLITIVGVVLGVYVNIKYKKVSTEE